MAAILHFKMAANLTPLNQTIAKLRYRYNLPTYCHTCIPDIHSHIHAYRLKSIYRMLLLLCIFNYKVKLSTRLSHPYSSGTHLKPILRCVAPFEIFISNNRARNNSWLNDRVSTVYYYLSSVSGIKWSPNIKRSRNKSQSA